MKERRYRVETSHVLYFQAEVARWIKRFGLTDWRIFHDTEDDEHCYAKTHLDVMGRAATIVLSSRWPERVTHRQLRRTALHEAAEVLLARLVWLGKQRETCKIEIDEETHAIIRRLESAFLEE